MLILGLSMIEHWGKHSSLRSAQSIILLFIITFLILLGWNHATKFGKGLSRSGLLVFWLVYLRILHPTCTFQEFWIQTDTCNGIVSSLRINSHVLSQSSRSHVRPWCFQHHIIQRFYLIILAAVTVFLICVIVLNCIHHHIFVQMINSFDGALVHLERLIASKLMGNSLKVIIVRLIWLRLERWNPSINADVRRSRRNMVWLGRHSIARIVLYYM